MIAKSHNQQRDEFVSQLKTYSWDVDPSRFKGIREGAQNLPSSEFDEPNFIQINNACKRADQLMKTFARNQDFKKCGEIKQAKTEIEEMVSAYLSNPSGNAGLLERIDQHVAQLKSIQF